MINVKPSLSETEMHFSMAYFVLVNKPNEDYLSLLIKTTAKLTQKLPKMVVN